MTDVEVRMILAAAVGTLTNRTSAMHVSFVLARVLAEVNPPHLRGMSLQEVAFHVAAKHGIAVDDLIAPSSREGTSAAAIAIPRQEAFWLARQQLGPDGVAKHPLPKIGRFFGRRDHTTVVHGVRAHRQRVLREMVG